MRTRHQRQNDKHMTTMQPTHHHAQAAQEAQEARAAGRSRPRPKRLTQVLGLTLSLALGLSSPASAGFLEDDYTAAGARTAVT